MTQLSTFLTASEVAKRYDTTPETVRRWARENKIPAVKMPSGRVKFRRAEIDALMPAETTPAEAPETAASATSTGETSPAPHTQPARQSA